jgi:hypothetical protein
MKPGDEKKTSDHDFESYFKIGISGEYILLRDDFPMSEITPGDFARITIEMFRRNDEAFEANNEK